MSSYFTILWGILSTTLLLAVYYSTLPVLAEEEVTSPRSVGVMACRECHKKEFTAWSSSHHAQAMQEASLTTVLGDFGDVSYTYGKTTTRFFMKNGIHTVHTDGPGGRLQDYRVKYTFGVFPLQQYLVELTPGTVQALPFAWDARPTGAGGGKWFHLYPDEKVTSGDPLHWTKYHFNWNGMCAECHSTNFQKNFDPVTNSYQSTWSEINVSCEACHGPGRHHIQEAKTGNWTTNKGFPISLSDRYDSAWKFRANAPIAVRSQERNEHTQVEACGRCHSRRVPITDQYEHGKPLLDTHLPDLLLPPLYHSDGQVNEEVYVYGSFLQSKMYQAGVTCSNCHEPHSGTLRAQGNALCSQCHQSEVFDTPKHHFHPTGSEGARCISCHMPEKTFMGVDTRHDHSFRIPRPDLTERLGVPNVCATCHTDKKASWAVAEVNTRVKESNHQTDHFGDLFVRGEATPQQHLFSLTQYIRDLSKPAILRATAIQYLSRVPGEKRIPALKQASQDKAELVRLAVALSLDTVPQEDRIKIGRTLLTDQLRAIRIEAARALSNIPAKRIDKDTAELYQNALKEYRKAQEINLDLPHAPINLALLATSQKKFTEAERYYRQALTLDPYSLVAHINLSDLYREVKQEQKAKVLLDQAKERFPNNPVVDRALKLWHARQ